MKEAVLVLEDGNQFYGRSIGANGESIGEIVFNTSMTGYQEIITDPSYANQIVALTYPHIGNVGINKLDNESDRIQIKGLVIRNSTIIFSNFRGQLSLSDYLIQQDIVGISDIDTRKLTRLIRAKGIQNACIVVTNGKPDIISIISKIQKFSTSYKSKLLAYKVSTSQQYIWNTGVPRWHIQSNNLDLTTDLREFYHVVVCDFGVKHNIMRILVDYGCTLTVVPAKTTAQEIINMKPDGIFLSNGPGDPNEYHYVVNIVQFLLRFTHIPIFGICLGYQLLALAAGAKIVKMKFGHHGSNHPVKDLESNKVIITTQNHNFVVDMRTLPDTLKITHISLFDGTLQGIRYCDKPAFGFQGHPEASPGPHDSVSIFDNFIKLIRNYHNKK